MKEAKSRLILFVGAWIVLVVVYLLSMWYVFFPLLDKLLPINEGSVG